jgi:hypothetical protein
MGNWDSALKVAQYKLDPVPGPQLLLAVIIQRLYAVMDYCSLGGIMVSEH